MGLANLEACLALVESSESRAQVKLTRHTPLSATPDFPDVVPACRA